MASSEINLKWSGYQINMLDSLKMLFHDEGYADVTLVVEGVSLKAHKVILSACSSLFRNIFTQNAFPHPIIVLNDISMLCMKSLLIFIYNGEVNVSEDFLPVLLKAAESLKIRGLSVASENGLDNISDNDHSLTSKCKQNYEEYNEVPDVTRCLKKERLSDDGDFYSGEKIIPKIEPPDIGVEAILNDLSDETNNENMIGNASLNMSTEITCRNEINKGQLELCELKKKCTKRKKTSKSKKWNSKRQKNLSKDSHLQHKHSICTKLIQECRNSGLSSVSGTEEESLDSLDKDVKIENDTDLHTGSCMEMMHDNIDVEGVNMDCNDPANGVYANPKFPCPFCCRVYHSWGYRRRHVKSHHGKNKLSCKWCCILLESQSAWFDHTVSTHGITRSEARDCLVVMVEAHAVLTSSPPSADSLMHRLDLKGEAAMD